MPYTTTEISDTVNKAKQAMADFVYTANSNETKGIKATDEYVKSRLLSGVIKALDNPNDLTDGEKTELVDSAYSTGCLDQYSVSINL